MLSTNSVPLVSHCDSKRCHYSLACNFNKFNSIKN